MRQLYALLVGGVALTVAVQGCKDPALYVGGPPGAAAALQVSNSKLALAIGETAMIGASALDSVGNATSTMPSFSSCDGSVVSVGTATPFAGFTNAAQLQAAGLGVSCVIVQAAGFTDTVKVSTGPAGVVIVGPDTVGSGNSASYTVEAYDAAGTVLTGTTAYEWSSSNTGRMSVDAASGEAAGKSTGSVTMRLVAPGGANAVKSLVVAPGVFGGALSATSAAPGALITATRAADGPEFDADVAASLDGVSAYVDEITPDAVMFAVPATGSAAAGTLTLANMGPLQIAQTTGFTASKAVEDVYSPGNIDNTCNVPGTIPVFENVMSPLGAVYIVHDGTTHGTGSCLDAGGGGHDHWFTFTTGATGVIDLVATWPLAGDYDLVICDSDAKVAGNDGSCSYGYSGNSNDETMIGVTLAANTQHWFAFETWSGNAGLNNVKIVLTKY
jgi:hypothetical protein